MENITLQSQHRRNSNRKNSDSGSLTDITRLMRLKSNSRNKTTLATDTPQDAIDEVDRLSTKPRKSSLNSSNRWRSTSLPPEANDSPNIPTPINVGFDERNGRGMSLFMAEVKLLSDEEIPLQLEVTNTCLGRALFNQVVEKLNGIVAKDYFGLRYLDRSKQRQWLEMTKTVYKQLIYVSPRSLNFRVKHYPSNPLSEFVQEKARYLLYLQLRRDLHSGRLIGRNAEMHMLAACILQAEIGDHDQLADYLGEEGSLADLKMFANVTSKTETKIRELHKTLKGLTVEEAENKFLEHASRFETYGIEPLYVQDRKGNHFYMGLSHEGVVTFRGSRKAHVFSWQKISKISYEGKLFIIQVEWEQNYATIMDDNIDANFAFLFLRLMTPIRRPGSGRCRKELMLLNTSLPTIPQPEVTRSRSLLNLAKSVRQGRHSKSQNDLDRKSTASGDNSPVRDLALPVGLQRHQSVLETRQIDDDGDSDMLHNTNQLGNQHFGKRLSKPMENSRSTPSLAQKSGRRSLERNVAAEDDDDDEDHIMDDGDPMLLHSRESELQGAHSPPTEQGSRSKPPRSTEASQSVPSPTSPMTSQLGGFGSNNNQQAMTVSTTGSHVAISPQSSNDADLSDIQQLAEATDKPLRTTDDGLGNSGSVNTLSSSPLRSVDGAEDSIKEDGDGENALDQETIEPFNQQGNWLGSGGVRSFEGNTRTTPLAEVSFIEPGKSLNIHQQLHQQQQQHNIKVQEETDTSKPIRSAMRKYSDNSKPERPTTLINTTSHVVKSSGQEPKFPMNSPWAYDEAMDRMRQNEGNRNKPPNCRASFESKDSIKFIDSPHNSPAMNNPTLKPQRSISKPHRISCPTEPIPRNGRDEKNKMHFPYARTFKTTQPLSSSQTPLESRISAPSRPIGGIGSSKVRGSPPPQEISLSSEHFTHTDRARPMVYFGCDIEERRKPRDLQSSHTRRSDDLSPQPRDWFQGPKTSLSSNELSNLSGLTISSPRYVSTDGTTRPMGMSSCTLINEDIIQPQNTIACGLFDSSLPPTHRSVVGRDASPSRRNDLLLRHGYQPVTTPRSEMNQLSPKESPREARLTAAQLAAGSTYPYSRNTNMDSFITDLDHPILVTSPQTPSVVGLGLSSLLSSESFSNDRMASTPGSLMTSRTLREATIPMGYSPIEERKIDTRFRSPLTPVLATTTNSMTQMADSRVQNIRSVIESGERSVTQLAQTLDPPPLAVKPNAFMSHEFPPRIPPSTLNPIQSDDLDPLPLIRQLVYYLIVGIFVFKLTTWLHIRPTIFGFSASTTTDDQTSASEQQEQQSSFSFFRIISTILRWLLSMDD